MKVALANVARAERVFSENFSLLVGALKGDAVALSILNELVNAGRVDPTLERKAIEQRAADQRAAAEPTAVEQTNLQRQLAAHAKDLAALRTEQRRTAASVAVSAVGDTTHARLARGEITLQQAVSQYFGFR